MIDKKPFLDAKTLGNGKRISSKYEVYTDHDKLGISAGLGPSAVITAVKDMIEMFLAVRLQGNVHGTILLFPMIKYCILIGCSVHTKSDIMQQLPNNTKLETLMTSSDQ